MIGAIPLWRQEFSLPPVSDISWAKNFADIVDGLVTRKSDFGVITPSMVNFTFSKPIFMIGLLSQVPTPIPAAFAELISTTWANAVMASIVVASPGASIGAPSPVTTFSVVATTVIEPASVASAKALLFQDLISMVPVSFTNQSIYADALFKAFTGISITITGMNSIPPPTGPLPLTVAGQKLY